MIRQYIFRVLFYLYLEIIDIYMSLQHRHPRNPITDLSQPIPVETYFDILMLTIQLADEPLKFLEKSQVTHIRIGKEIKGIAQHEYTLAKVHLESEIYYFRLERTRGAQSQHTIEELKASDDPELSEIGNTLGNLAASPSEVTSSPVSTAQHPTSETLSSVSSAPVNPPNVSYPTKFEAFSTNTINSINTSKSISGKPLHLANDTISRVPSLDPPFPDITLHDIYPENLTWLQFMLIANLIHSEDRIYSVFRSQCYWYSQLIFLLVQAKFSPDGTEKGPVASDDSVAMHISRHLSHPDPGQRYIKLEKSKNGMAPGTWMSVQVTQVKIALLDKLRREFDSTWNVVHQNVCEWFLFLFSSRTFTI